MRYYFVQLITFNLKGTKSVTNSSKKEKGKGSSHQSKNVQLEHSDVLNQVFNYFEDKISKTKNVNLKRTIY